MPMEEGLSKHKQLQFFPNLYLIIDPRANIYLVLYGAWRTFLISASKDVGIKKQFQDYQIENVLKTRDSITKI